MSRLPARRAIVEGSGTTANSITRLSCEPPLSAAGSFTVERLMLSPGSNWAHPLLDALQQGFCSVEADVHLVDGELFVAHDANEIKPDRTLRKLYLEPLLARVRAHGGRAYEGARDLHDASRGDLIPLISDNRNLHFRWRGGFDRAGAAERVATDRLTRDR